MSKDIQQQKKFKILIIGESCEDHYVFGDVNRINPEAPVPILKMTHKEKKLGMVKNVYNNIKSILDKDCEIDLVTNDSKKIQKTRYIDNRSNYQILRMDKESQIDPFIFEIKKDYDVIVVSDYNKGLINDSNFLKIKKESNCPVFVDTKKTNLSLYHDCIIKINEKESKECENLEKRNTIITLGAKGCSYQNEIYKTKKVEAYDVCGAGDVFLATLVCNWLQTKDIISSIKTANNCASLSVTKLGCYTLKKREYENLRF